MDIAPVRQRIISSRSYSQGSLFAEAHDSAKSSGLMSVLDGINTRIGKGVLRLVSDGTEQGWRMKNGNGSPADTSNWRELPIVASQGKVGGKQA